MIPSKKMQLFKQLMRSLSVLVFISATQPAVAQLRNYGLVYSDNAKVMWRYLAIR